MNTASTDFYYEEITKKLLGSDRLWTVNRWNHNIITSSAGEAIHIHEDEIRYWEDIRVTSYETYTLPDFLNHWK